MQWGWLVPVLIVASISASIAFTNWVRAKHGYPLDDGNGNLVHQGLGADRKAELLASENEALKGQVGRLEERIAVLERIATDPAERTSRQIEQLRQGDA